MAIRQNFGYQQDPGAVIGSNLARALFGDPEMAQAQQEHQAQMALREAQTRLAGSHAGLFDAQTQGVGIQNSASQSLPALIQSLFPQPQAAPVAMPSDPLAPLPEAPAPTGFNEEAFKAGLPAVVGAMAQMQGGDHVDPNGIVGLLTAMLGNDEFARRGMVGQGKTPGEDFALTADRADAISARDAKEDFTKDTRVAEINHATDIPVANIKAGADVDVATINNRDDIEVARINNEDGVLGNAAALGASFGQVTSTVRTPAHNKKVGGVANSHHLASNGGNAIDIARAPGVTHAQVVAGYRARGFTIGENLDEGDHSHIVILGGPGKAKAAKAAAKPKDISSADIETLTKQLDEAIEASGLEVGPKSKQGMLRAATNRLQVNGNPVRAAQETVAEVQQKAGAGGAKPAAQPAAKPNKAANTEKRRRDAKVAISKGADPAAVRAHFRQLTGEDL